jgi:hypothetical protein
VALKEAEELPAAIATEPGIVSTVEEVESVTIAAPALESVTVQVAEAVLARLAGVHDSAATWAAATSETNADLEPPLSDAVMTAP